MDELTFAGLGGTNTLLCARANSPSDTLVIIAPALGLRASYYRGVAEALAAAGLDAAVVEWPGHGSSPVRAGRAHDWGYADLRRHLTLARAALQPHARTVWLGHSIGGQVAMMEAGEHGASVAGVVLIASGTPWRGAWTGLTRASITAATFIFPVAGALVGHHPGERLGFGGREARTLMREWSGLARTGDYPADAASALANCTCPILAVRVDGDDWAPARAVEHGLSKVGSPRIERHVWSGLPPENVHNRWPRSDALPVARIGEFIATLR